MSAVTPRDLLHPEVAQAIGNLPFDELTADVLPSLRTGMSKVAVPLSDAVERTDHVVPGDPEVVVRVHRAKGVDGALPCLYSMHGGGYVLGSNVMDDPIFDTLCPTLGVVAVSVEYRLAPDTPYPGAAGGLLPGIAMDV